MIVCFFLNVFTQKTLIRQFSNGEERLQKKQPIRNQDDSEMFLNFNDFLM